VHSLCVFCGSSPGTRPEYLDAALAFGRLVASRGLTLVYGGAAVGLMGAVADAALEAGGEVIGVLPHHLASKEIGHPGLTRLELVDTMHERKARMAELSDAFVALPGGLGTFEELFEIWTWGLLGLHRKPCGLLDVAGYYDHLITFLDHARAEDFVRPHHREMLVVERDGGALIDALARYEPPLTKTWVTPSDVAPVVTKLVLVPGPLEQVARDATPALA